MSAVDQAAAEVFAEAPETGKHFTCTEAEAIGVFVLAHSGPDAAGAFLYGHAVDDEDGERHQGWTEEQCLRAMRS